MKISSFLCLTLGLAVCLAATAVAADPGLAAHLMHSFQTPEVGAGLMLTANGAAAPLLQGRAVKEIQGFMEASAKLQSAHQDHLEDLDRGLSAVNSQLGEIAERLASLQLEGIVQPKGSAPADHKIFSMVRGGPEIDREVYNEYRQAFGGMLRLGPALSPELKNALSVGSDPEGGYLVPADTNGKIVSRIHEISPMRQVATVTQAGSDALEGINDLQEAEAGWISEQGSRAETNTPQLGKWQIAVHEIYAQPRTTLKLLEDAMWDVEGWLENKCGSRFARVESDAFFNGNGVGKPHGLLTYPTATTADENSRPWGTFQHVEFDAGASPEEDLAEALIDVQGELSPSYLPKAVWMMNRRTAAMVRKMKDSEGRFVWQPSLVAGQPPQLLGHPVILAEHMPAFSSGNLPIAFGDFSEGYMIVDRLGMFILRDPYSQKGYVSFYCKRRVGGAAMNFDAIKFLKVVSN